MWIIVEPIGELPRHRSNGSKVEPPLSCPSEEKTPDDAAAKVTMLAHVRTTARHGVHQDQDDSSLADEDDGIGVGGLVAVAPSSSSYLFIIVRLLQCGL